MSNQYPTVLLLSRLQSELNRLFNEFMEFDEGNLEEGEWSPRIDIVESSEALILLAEVPGMAASELTLEIAGNLVTLSGDKRLREERLGDKPLGDKPLENPGGATIKRRRKSERIAGRFVRKIKIFRPVNTLLAKAKLSQGLLTISFPKVEDQRQKVRALEIDEEANDG